MTNIRIKKPRNPIPREGFPKNREEIVRDGVRVLRGRACPVGTGDSWETVGKFCDGIPAEEVAYANFETYDPAEINWYLKEYVGCHKPGPRGFNFSFDDAKPGLILYPYRDALISDFVERAHRQEERRQHRTILDRRWDKRDIDIPEGKKSLLQTREMIFRRVQNHVPNPYDFDLQKELTGFLVGAIFDGGKSLLTPHKTLVKVLGKPLKELHPGNEVVRELRKRYYRGFANGMAVALCPGYDYPLHDRIPGEVYFYRAGLEHGRQMNGLQRYQFVMGLMERVRGYGLQGGNPIYRQKANYARGFAGAAVASYLTRELSSARLLERNIHETPLIDDIWDATKDAAKDKVKDAIGIPSF